jgi:hypothetical protein
MINNRWLNTPERVAEFTRAWESGARLSDMAAQYGVSKSTISATAARLGLVARNGARAEPVLKSVEEVEAFKADWMQRRLSLSTIAARHGFKNNSAASRHAQSLGLPPRRDLSKDSASPHALTNGRWESNGRVSVWVWGAA